MNFAELDQLIPEGFHDADLLRIDEDFAASTIRLLIDFWWRGPEDPEDKPDQKLAWLTLHGVQRWVWEYFSTSRNTWGDRIQIDGGEADSKFQSEHSSAYEGIGGAALKGWLFVHDWNAIVFWAASDMSLEFVDS